MALISANYVLRTAYAGNTNFKNDDFRRGSSNHDTVAADRKAMVKGLDMLEKLDFSNKEQENTKNIYNTVKSFIGIYNNSVSSTKNSASKAIVKTSGEMKELAKKYEKELSEMGISVKSDGSLKVDEKKFKVATTADVKKVFSSSSDFPKDMKKIMKKLRDQVSRDVSVAPKSSGSTIDSYA